MQEQWNDLLATALLGTAQRRSTVVAPEIEFLNAAQAATPPQDHEAWVLLASAYAATYRRAGQIPRPLPAETRPAPAAPETRPYCSARLAAHLATAISQQRTMSPFIEEILLILDKQGGIVPPILLPDLLTWAQRSKAWRALIAPVVGKRGQWLTQVNPEWKNALQVDDADRIDYFGFMQRITGQAALYNLLDITENIFNKSLSVILGQSAGVQGRMIQLVVDRLTTLAKPGGTTYADLTVSNIAVAVPAAALPEIIGKLNRALATKEYLPWLTTLTEGLELRQQMLEELKRE